MPRASERPRLYVGVSRRKGSSDYLSHSLRRVSVVPRNSGYQRLVLDVLVLLRVVQRAYRRFWVYFFGHDGTVGLGQLRTASETIETILHVEPLTLVLSQTCRSSPSSQTVSAPLDTNKTVVLEVRRLNSPQYRPASGHIVRRDTALTPQSPCTLTAALFTMAFTNELNDLLAPSTESLAPCRPFIEGRRVPLPCSILPRLGLVSRPSNTGLDNTDDDVNVEHRPLRGDVKSSTRRWTLAGYMTSMRRRAPTRGSVDRSLTMCRPFLTYRTSLLAFRTLFTYVNDISFNFMPLAETRTPKCGEIYAIFDTTRAGYLGSSLIDACLITCGFNTNASKVATIVLAVFFLLTLWWARRNWLTWLLIAGMSGLILLFWFVADGVALRYLVLFIGVMSCMYVLWDVIDDTIARKVNSSDASAFAKICGCFPSQVWGVIWLIVAFIFFAAGIIVGLVAFKQTAEEQKADSQDFLPTPGSGALSISPSSFAVSLTACGLAIFGLL
ncbi:hypothetical protein BDZ89DRAFT_1136958 [Hymenopellis radicata]|nr:hypothetical protein BDZ89DRAFT_1136958 [Hymenopellis radicata]